MIMPFEVELKLLFVEKHVVGGRRSMTWLRTAMPGSFNHITDRVYTASDSGDSLLFFLNSGTDSV